VPNVPASRYRVVVDLRAPAEGVRDVIPLYAALADPRTWFSVAFQSLDELEPSPLELDELERVRVGELGAEGIRAHELDEARIRPHAFVGRLDRDCELCRLPARNPIHLGPTSAEVLAAIGVDPESSPFVELEGVPLVDDIGPGLDELEVPAAPPEGPEEPRTPDEVMPTPEELLEELGRPVSGPGCFQHPGAHDPTCAYCAASAGASSSPPAPAPSSSSSSGVPEIPERPI
jgi:hypothetical protein